VVRKDHATCEWRGTMEAQDLGYPSLGDKGLMNKIQRPTDIGMTGVMLHLAEYFLSQAVDILAHIMIAPSSASTDCILERAGDANEVFTFTWECYIKHTNCALETTSLTLGDLHEGKTT